jgi:hypothetical protein
VCAGQKEGARRNGKIKEVRRIGMIDITGSGKR